MKVTVDGILGTARKINSQKELDEKNLGKKQGDIKTDSVSIGSRINTRLDAIETELREIQTSLTKNQIIRDGIERLREDFQKGAPEQKSVLEGVTFEGRQVLQSFMGEQVTGLLIEEKAKQNASLIQDDITRLKRLQVELDNITASNLAGQDRLGSIMANVDSVFSGAPRLDPETLSTLRPDTVMRLIK